MFFREGIARVKLRKQVTVPFSDGQQVRRGGEEL